MNKTCHALLPKKAISAVMYRLARIENRWFAKTAIHWFMKATGANLQEAARQNISDYASLQDFFTRELNENARPIAKDAVTSPVDGTVAHVGNILDNQIFQIKGYTYALSDLLGTEMASRYQNGVASTIYLAPYDYHRIHAPLSGTLKHAYYHAGELNSVALPLLSEIAGLFAKNERVVLEFEHQANGKSFPFVVVLVGAVNVGSISTRFHGEIKPLRAGGVLELACHNEQVNAGDEIGRFNLGSTVIVIAPQNAWQWQIHDAQKLKMGQAIAHLS